jgi:ribonuclease D
MFAHTTDDLARIAAAARSCGVLAFDTEFMREKTYWARLCLLQFAADGEAWIVDPFELADLGPVADVLADPNVVKVVHAGAQDLEILVRMLGRATAPVFDTQIAATVAGFPSQVGYARLVKDMLDIDIDKSDTYTDWSRRPLTPAQIEYALADVLHLPEMYRRLGESLARDGRLAWLEADFARLADPATYEAVPEEQFRRIKRASSLSRRQLAVLREATAWREREAQRRDLPRKWVIADETLVEVARRQPKDVAGLGELRGLSVRSLGDNGRSLVEAVRRGLAVPDADLPRIDVEGIVELMGALVRVRAREHGVAVPLLASRADLERLASGERDECTLLQGWRRTLVGEELVELVEGRLSLRVLDGVIVPKRAGDTADADAPSSAACETVKPPGRRVRRTVGDG